MYSKKDGPLSGVPGPLHLHEELQELMAVANIIPVRIICEKEIESREKKGDGRLRELGRREKTPFVSGEVCGGVEF